MWTVVYDRHLWSQRYRTSRFYSRHFLVAWLVYQVWAYRYSLSVLPVKRVSLYWADNKLVRFYGTMRSRNYERLGQVKWR